MPLNAPSPEIVSLLIAAWLFAVGGAIGSFLNVVVYRLPAGRSLVTPASHCPKCEHPIRWFDNLPMLGWVILGGRCRDCGGKISARYPIVEALTATLFLVLWMVECVWGGLELPSDSWQLYAVYSYHLLLLCTLLAAALIEYDGNRVPPRLFAPAVIVGVVAAVAWPWLHPTHTFAGLFLGWQSPLVLAIVAVVVYLPFRAAGVRFPTRTSRNHGGCFTTSCRFAQDLIGNGLKPIAMTAIGTLCWIMGWAWLASMVQSVW
ncbi:MAG: prepilin peptidase [Thermoguttaceae bacterium]